VTRGRAFRHAIRAATHELTRLEVEALTEHEIRRRLAADGGEVTEEVVAAALDGLEKMRAGEWVLTPQDATFSATAMEVADELVPHLLFRHGLVYNAPPVLVTCDEPVVPLGGPGFPREQVSGFDDVPFTPSKLLVLLRSDLQPETDLSLDEDEAAEVNRELVASPSRWVFEQPAGSVGMDTEVPSAPEALGIEHLTGNSDVGTPVQLQRQYRPSRWTAAPETPWPVARWWVRWSDLG